MTTAVIKRLKNFLRNYTTVYKGYRYYKNISNNEFLRRGIHYATRGHFIRWLRICWFLRRNDKRKLQVGGGIHKVRREGWLNGDIIAGDIYLNAKKAFPFPNESIDIVFAEQFIEHLKFSDGFEFLEECHRVLKKGGKIRLATPDLKLLISTYEDRNPNVTLKTAMQRHKNNHNRALTTACHFLNDFFRLWGHSFIYDDSTLGLHVRNAGFSNVIRKKFGDSEDEDLVNLERHADVEWMKDAFQLILEAQKK